MYDGHDLNCIFSYAYNLTSLSVLYLKVGLLGTAISLQKDLNRIAESADTSTSKGFWYILNGNEMILAILMCHVFSMFKGKH